MFLRNLMAMDTEEMIRAQPMDAVVLIGGCDKTVPAQLMGAASADMPAIVLPTGPMLTGHHQGERLGACTDCRRFWAQYRAGEIDAAEIDAVNDRLVPTAGTCTVMGTASTMACIAEALGMIAAGRRRRRRRCTPTACASPRRPASARSRWRKTGGPRPTRADHRSRACRTRCACCWRSAARPTASSI